MDIIATLWRIDLGLASKGDLIDVYAHDPAWEPPPGGHQRFCFTIVRDLPAKVTDIKQIRRLVQGPLPEMLADTRTGPEKSPTGYVPGFDRFKHRTMLDAAALNAPEAGTLFDTPPYVLERRWDQVDGQLFKLRVDGHYLGAAEIG